MNRTWIIVFGAGGIAILDLAAKWLAIQFLTEPVRLIPGFLEFELAHNPGLAFGLTLPRWAILAVSLVAICLLVWVFARMTRPNSHLATAAFALLLGGAAGNFLERLVDGTVTDFVYLWPIPNFNLADVALTFGALGLILFSRLIFKS